MQCDIRDVCSMQPKHLHVHIIIFIICILHNAIFGVMVLFFGNIEPFKPHNKYFLNNSIIHFICIYITYTLRLDPLQKQVKINILK